jgi:hypothetical protein
VFLALIAVAGTFAGVADETVGVDDDLVSAAGSSTLTVTEGGGDK